MRGNGKVFISHAHDDNARCAPLLAALDAWGVDYWFDTERITAGDGLAERIQPALLERDIFLRVCTAAAQRSYWVGLETGAFRGLMAQQRRAGEAPTRALINLILGDDYQIEPFDHANIFLDARGKAPRVWLDELRRALAIEESPATDVALESVDTATARLADGPRTLVVSRRGAGRYTTVQAAVEAARDGDRILIPPGRYAESLAVTKAVELVGDGERSAIILEGREESALRFAAARGRIANLTLRQVGGGYRDCVVIERGAPLLEACDISAETRGACVNVTGEAEPVIRGCALHDGEYGVFIGSVGVVTLEDNTITANGASGVTLMRGGYAQIRRNRIGRNAQYGIRVDASAGGVIEDNDLRGNYQDALSVDRASYGKVMQARNKA